ncbi:MAG: aminomethyl-transferring glycine dehydrogenase subunit GcvPA [Chloroflexi bacterium]|nr:aminomethyl-transferring glycine dehydrogenase subunit GcvPA [Chloroflexota bacterium]
MTTNTSPYIPNTEADREQMLAAIGVRSIDDLVQDIPEQHRFPDLNLRPSLSEFDLTAEIAALADKNATPGEYACFLGAGAYRHYIPSVVKSVVARGEFLTSYTPYQPEVAQGTLQVGFEFQSMICEITGMEVANAGMYDGPTAFAEGALMACRVTRRQTIAVLDTVDPRNVAILDAYSRHQSIEIVTIGRDDDLPDDASCLMIQSPNQFGAIEDMEALANKAHAAGALAVASVNPTSLGMFKSPGECDVDIVAAEGQALGVPLSFGGPYVGLFACKDAHKRQMPGRIIGRTTDTKGRIGYALTLQTREQHIRRERATSNICTSTALIGLLMTTYLAVIGRSGFKKVAELCYHKAHYAASQIGQLPGYSVKTDGTFFHEFLVECPKTPAEINRSLLDHKIIGGHDLSDRSENGMLICVTETNTRAEVDSLVSALAQIGGAK